MAPDDRIFPHGDTSLFAGQLWDAEEGRLIRREMRCPFQFHLPTERIRSVKQRTGVAI
jgi:hypothetical protein